MCVRLNKTENKPGLCESQQRKLETRVDSVTGSGIAVNEETV